MALIWSEDFQSGLSKWRVQTGDNWDNGATDQRYTGRLENLRTTPEGLVIECRRERMAGSTREFTSARIDSRGTLTLRRGYIEVVAAVTLTAGSWPQIWTLGGEQGYRRGWPGGGEIDLVEFTNGRVMLNVHAGSPHWQYGWGSPGARQPEPGTGFHAYGAYFDETKVVLYVDRVPKVTVNRGARSDLDWPFGTEPQWVILNYATGSAGGEPLNGIWPQRMVVQSVSAYDAVPVPDAPPVEEPPVEEPPPPPPPALAKPGIPARLTAKPDYDRLLLVWDPRPAEEAVDVYQVYVDGKNTPPSDLAVARTTYTLEMPPGVPVSVRVGAHNAAGYGPWSQPITWTPTAPPPVEEPPPPPPLDLAGIRADLFSARTAIEAAIRKVEG